MPKIRLYAELDVDDPTHNAFIEKFLEEASAVYEDMGGRGGTTTSAETVPTEPRVDKHGVPYNPDFHTSTGAIKNDGSWKLKPKVDKDAAAAYAAQHVGHTPNIQANPEDRQDPNDMGDIPPGLDRRTEAPPATMPQAGAPTIPAAGGMPQAGAPGLPAATTPPPVTPVTMEDLQAAFQGLIERLNGDAAAAGDHVSQLVYPKLGITDVAVLNTDESLRRQVVEALSLAAA